MLQDIHDCAQSKKTHDMTQICMCYHLPHSPTSLSDMHDMLARQHTGVNSDRQLLQLGSGSRMPRSRVGLQAQARRVLESRRGSSRGVESLIGRCHTPLAARLSARAALGWSLPLLTASLGAWGNGRAHVGAIWGGGRPYLRISRQYYYPSRRFWTLVPVDDDVMLSQRHDSEI
jgi:hypothetical protein